MRKAAVVRLLGASSLAVCLLIVSPPMTSAGTLSFDHLRCFKLAYSKKQGASWTPNAHASDTLTLTPEIPPFATDTGCRLLPKKKPHPIEICTPVDKAPRQGTGPELGVNYLCYMASCTAGTDTTLSIADQFGSGQAIVKAKNKTRRLCVPEPAG